MQVKALPVQKFRKPAGLDYKDAVARWRRNWSLSTEAPDGLRPAIEMNTLGFVASIHGNDTLRFRVSHSYDTKGRRAEHCGSSMKRIRNEANAVFLLLGGIGIAASQSATDAIVTNLSTANWTHEKGAEVMPDGWFWRTRFLPSSGHQRVEVPAVRSRSPTREL